MMTEQTSRRDRVSQFAANSGLTSLLESYPRNGSVVVLNYHRIGNWEQSLDDQQVFSASQQGFVQQMEALKRKATVVGLDEAIELSLSRKPFRGSVVLLTFDDGYLDNYETAFPVLENLGLPATFFLVTSFVGSSRRPWWDEIAFLVRASNLTTIELDYPTRRTVRLNPGQPEAAIREIAECHKRCADSDRFLSELRNRCGMDEPDSAREGLFIEGYEDRELIAARTETRAPTYTHRNLAGVSVEERYRLQSEMPEPGNAGHRLFLNWREAREMTASGMDIGAHTHTHRNLARLPFEEQVTELQYSRRELEAKLNRKIDVLAYPYGTADCFNRDTISALERTGYRAAFSYYGGINRPDASTRYNLLRCSVDHSITTARFRLRLATSPLFGGYWF